MIEVFDRTTRRRVAILENACAVSEQQRINALWHLSFSLPCNDPKNKYCQPFHYVRRGDGELYRIMPAALAVDETGCASYQCEHVLATLIDNILFGCHVVGNLGTCTADVIRYVLNHQLVKNWVLDECDYRNQFEYGWEQESLLSALFSVATPLAGKYIWRTDTSVHPWRLSLKRLDTAGLPELYVRRKHNMTSYQRGSDPQQIVTRLYPKGYGEGVNQLGIESVNGGVPYLQSPGSITGKYGIIERAWIDRRYEDPESLKAAAQALLDELQEPLVSYTIGFQEVSRADFDRAAVGKRVRILFPELEEAADTYVTEINRNYDDVEQSTITVANRETSIAAAVADLADRLRIEQAYAQGATQIYAQALQTNCDSKHGAVMDFIIPSQMRIVNKVLVKVRMRRFRAYSKATETAAQTVQTTSYEGSSVVTSTSTASFFSTSDSGGGTSSTSDSGGGTTATSEGGGGSTTDTGPAGINVVYDYGQTETTSGHAHRYRTVVAHQHRVTFADHVHRVTIPAHSHTFTVQPHAHTFRIEGHSHNVTIKAHKHTITIKGHAHSITPGIFEYGSAKSFGIYVNGTLKASHTGSSAELDITNMLLDQTRRIPRGSWLDLEVRPDDLAYVSIDLVIQGFVQSRGDNTV